MTENKYDLRDAKVVSVSVKNVETEKRKTNR